VAAAGVAAIAVAGALSAAASGSPASSTVFLISNRGVDITEPQCDAQGGCGPEVSDPMVLAAGQSYTVKVSGTVSVWNVWSDRPCGHPLKAAYPTPGRNTPTSDDAVFRFAFRTRALGCPPLPRHMGLFQINVGSGWFTPVAVGNPTRPSGDDHGLQHPYTFIVKGIGAHVEFRFVDPHPSDNSGKFKIEVSGG
jgi:hypothetical protein